MTCPHCATPIPKAAGFCPGCGAIQSSLSQMQTAVAGAERPRAGHAAPIGRLDASHSPHATAFAAGQVLEGRYRIIGLLGRGGMGEVYRADDLTLGQPVSLKFLPRSMSSTPGLIDRFRAEVRNARHVSHPNVCRVYDIGELDGQQFLTMEFVDGEDLGTLLRRIGHLPATKAHEVSRQICAGLAAAHDKGVLHRDLKPSNIMIDGDGRVRITDFGLAVRTEEGAADFAGTPAYMSPEQFEGKPATERSDLYSVGLILYEIYTGHRPFAATTMAEWRNRHTQSEPTRPSHHGEPLDEVTERAILRCLEKDPSRRPVSALQLAAALPGGDPVAAALAAGETPSPEMVAASGGEGAMSPRAAWLALAGFAVALAALLALAPWATDFGLAPLTRGPGALRERAHQVLSRFGLDHDAVDSADWFERDYDMLSHVAVRTPSVQWRPQLARSGAPVRFMYRQSPDYMRLHDWLGRVSAILPPPIVPGMVQVELSAEGRLRALDWVPPPIDSVAPRPSRSAEWAALFEEAGLDASKFGPVEPTLVPPHAFDTRAEWTGRAPWAPGTELRVGAAAYHGTPCFFVVNAPWSKPLVSLRPPLTEGTWRVLNIVVLMTLVLAGAGGMLAYRNVRGGRGDRRGAFRVGAFLFCLGVLAWATRTHYFPEFTTLMWNFANQGVGPSLTLGLITASLYLALEPYMRRRMPELLVGWARLLEGRMGDARVGRDILLGAVAGALFAVAFFATSAATSWFPTFGETSVPADLNAMRDGLGTFSHLVTAAVGAVQRAMMMFAALFLLRLLLRNHRLALVAFVLISSVMSLGGGGENPAIEWPAALTSGVLMGWCVSRGGLLAMMSMFFFSGVLLSLPLPLAAGAPYTATSVTTIALLIALALHAFRRTMQTKLGFGRRFADELS